MNSMLDTKFWKGKKVFLTGHTGFKGGWTALWLCKLGAVVKGFSLPPSSTPSLYEVARISEDIESTTGDIRNLAELKRSMLEFEPDIVIHMAAQALVRDSYVDPVGTYQTNVLGTVNLLEAVRGCESVRAVVNVTTDKCYENNEWVWGYRETEPMGGHDPYSSSKGCSELVTSAYRKSFFSEKNSPAVASARAGNVIGGGDWATDRLIPDALKAFHIGEPVVIRNPLAVRPWQHVLEPISGYLMLAEGLYNLGHEYAEGWNFGPNEGDAKQVGEVLDCLVNYWSSNVCWISDETDQPHEARLLKLDISKAKARLKWEPKWNLDKALKSIVDWDQLWISGEDMKKISLNQINNYELSIREKT